MFAPPDNSQGPLVNGIKRVRYSHDSMIDLIIATPWVRQREIARHFGISECWISQVFNSDSFKKRLEERKAELVDPMIVEQIEKGFETLCRMSMEVLKEKLETERDSKVALGTLAVAAKALGFGARAEPQTQVNWFQQIVQNNGGHASLIKSPEAGRVVDGTVVTAAPSLPTQAPVAQQQPVSGVRVFGGGKV